MYIPVGIRLGMDRMVEGAETRDEVVLDPERQVQAREYARKQRLWMGISLAWSGILVIGFLLSGASRGLKELLLGYAAGSPWILVGLYVAAVLIGYTLLGAPLDWWSGYVLPRRYGLSTQTPARWLADEGKALGLNLVLGVGLAEVVYWLLRRDPTTWWAWAALCIAILGVILSFVAPVLLMPLYYRQTPLEDADLLERIRRLAERSKVRLSGVYTINLSARTTAANAAVVGMGRTRRILLGDTLYAQYSPEEIEAIVGHELGHQVHHDVALGTVVQGLLPFAGLYLAQQVLEWGVDRFHFQGPGDVAALPLLIIAVGLVSLVALPLANTYSRWRESLADRYALQVAGDPTALARALLRLANQNLAEADPPSWVVWLLYSHPPLRERVSQVYRKATD